jgi:hypothetical protein
MVSHLEFRHGAATRSMLRGEVFRGANKATMLPTLLTPTERPNPPPSIARMTANLKAHTRLEFVSGWIRSEILGSRRAPSGRLNSINLAGSAFAVSRLPDGGWEIYFGKQ